MYSSASYRVSHQIDLIIATCGSVIFMQQNVNTNTIPLQKCALLTTNVKIKSLNTVRILTWSV